MAAPRRIRPSTPPASDTPAVPSTMLSPEPGSPDSDAVSGNGGITPAEVAAEAFALYLARGGQDGDDLGDWYAAEEIVRERHGSQHDREHEE